MRQNVTAFKDLIETPETNQVVLPANGRFAISKSSGASAGTSAMTITTSTVRAIKTPLLSANQLMILDWFEKGATIDIESGFELFVDVGLNEFKKIAEGV